MPIVIAGRAGGCRPWRRIRMTREISWDIMHMWRPCLEEQRVHALEVERREHCRNSAQAAAERDHFRNLRRAQPVSLWAARSGPVRSRRRTRARMRAALHCIALHRSGSYSIRERRPAAVPVSTSGKQPLCHTQPEATPRHIAHHAVLGRFLRLDESARQRVELGGRAGLGRQVAADQPRQHLTAPTGPGRATRLEEVSEVMRCPVAARGCPPIR